MEIIAVSLRRLGESELAFMEKALADDARVLVADAETIRLLQKMKLLKALGGLEVVVLGGRRLEEKVLELISVYTPSKAYVCDEKGSLTALTVILEKLPIPIVKC